MLIPNLNRDKGPQRPKPKANKNPGPTTYQVEKKDERKILGNLQKSFSTTLGTTDRAANKKLNRFIDIHKKRKEWVPPVTKYHTPMEKISRYTSPSPTRLAHKK